LWARRKPSRSDLGVPKSAAAAGRRLQVSLPCALPCLKEGSRLQVCKYQTRPHPAWPGEIDAGNRPMGKWTSTGWKNLVVKYHEKTGLNQTKEQLKNKLDYMKKEYTWFMELKNSDTGLGWNEAKQTVECSNDWWNEHLAKGIKCNHVKFRKQGPKHLDDLHILFEKVHVTGASASCPGHISSDESSDDDVAEVQKTPEKNDMKLAELKKAKPGKKKRKDNSTATEEKDEKSPFFRLYKNTCKRIETAADKISKCFSIISSSSKPSAYH
ncbi:hypothetical protein EJB05_49943, partial [Eragrostis curvula]